MASARQSALYERRTQYRSPFSSESRKVLAPASTGISSIAKQSAANETDIMIAKYNAGQIGNEEMKAFLQAQLNNQYVSASDKTQIQTKLLDFDVLIEKDRLESVFKQAPENSLQKIQAATALADFYNRRASTMVAGTQAHSQALENAGAWQAQVASIQESTNKQQRKNLQYKLLNDINQLPNSSSDKATARAEMYKQLYDMAIQQGDQEDAQVYAANMQQEMTNAQQYAAVEETRSSKQQRRDIINEFNIVKNAYWTGQISYKEYRDYLIQLNDYAMQNEDGTLQNTITSEATRMEKQQAKGGVTGTNVGGGLFVKGKTGTGTGSATAADVSDFTYSDDVRTLQELYVNGMYDNTKYSSPEEQFQVEMSKTISERAASLEAQYNEAEAIARENPNAKILYNGKKTRAEEVVNDLNEKLSEVQSNQQALEAGTLAVIEVPPSQFTKAGAFKTSGKQNVTYELFDTRNIPEGALIQKDESGVYHMGYLGKEEISQDDYNILSDDERYRDSQTGKYYKYSGVQYDVFDPESGSRIRQKEGEYGRPVASAFSIIEGEKQQLGVKPGEAYEVNPEKAARVNLEQQAMTTEQARKSQEKAKKIQALQQPQLTEQPIVKPPLQQPVQPTPTVTPMVSEGELGQKIIQTAQGAQKQISDLNTNVIQPTIQKAAQAAQPVIQKAQQVAQPVYQAASTSTGQYKPSVAVQQAVQPVVQKVQQTVSTPSGQYAPAVKLADIYKTGVSNVQQAAQAIGTKIKDTASNVWNKIKWW